MKGIGKNTAVGLWSGAVALSANVSGAVLWRIMGKSSFSLKSVMALVLVAVFSFSASAATKTSTGTGGNWNVAATWIGGVPVAGDDVIIADGTIVNVTANIALTLNSLTIGQGTGGTLNFNTAASGITGVTTTTTITAGGTLNISNTGAKSFGSMIVNGTYTNNNTTAVTIANLTVNGIWNNGIIAVPYTITGGLTVNNGATFTSGLGVYSMTGTAQTIGGTIPALSISSLSPTSCTNTIPTLTIGTALGGTSLIMSANTTLNLGGTSLITTLNCTTNTPNTVAYTGGASTVKGTTYNNLVMSLGATAVAQGAITTTNLTMTSGTFTTSTQALTATNTTVNGGTLSINGATGAKALGTTTINGGTISCTAAIGVSMASLTINSGATWTSTAGTMSILGDLVNAGTFTNTGGTFTLSGNITNDGTFTSGTGLYTLNGAGKTINTTVGVPLSINSITINGSGTYTVSSNFTSPATFSIPTALILSTATNTLTNNGNMIAPTVTITLGAFTNNDTLTSATNISGTGSYINGATGVVFYGGTVFNPGTLNISAVGNTVVYTGAAAQTVHSSINYYNLIIAKTTGTVAAFNAITNIRNNLTVLSGTLSDGLSPNSYQTVGNATGQLTVAAGATLLMGYGGATTTNIPTLYTTANINLDPASNVTYNTTAAITISALPASYGNLILSGNGTKTAGAAHIIQGSLTINAGTFADAGNAITVNGNVTNTGTHTGAGKIYLNGGSAVHTLSGTGPYTNLELDDANGANMAGSFAVNGTLTLTSGTYAVGSFILSLNGPAIAGTGTNLSTTTTSSLVFGPGVANTNTGLYIPSSVSNLSALTINILAANSVTTNSDITLNLAGVELTLTSGKLDINSHNLTIGATNGTITGGSATSFVLADGANGGQLLKTLPVGTTTTFIFPIGDNTGTAEYSPVTFTTFTAVGGTETIGVNVTDAVHPQINSNQLQTNYISRYWTFSESGAATSYTYANLALTYINTVSDVVGTITTANDQINRYDGTWSTLNSTISGAVATTSPTQNNVSGALGGNDFTVRLNAPTVYTWNNNAGGLWTTPTNWTPTRNSPANSDVLIFDGSVTAGPITVTAVPVQTISQLQVINGVDVSLQSATTATTLTCGFSATSNVLTVDAASTLELSSTGTNVLTIAFPALTALSTNIAGTININANTGLTNGLNFTNLLAANNTITGTINNSGVVTSATALVTAFGPGSFYTHNRNAGAIPTIAWNATSTLTVSGVTATVPTGLTGTFGNLIWNNPAQTATGGITAAVTLQGDLTVTAGTLYFASFAMNVAGDVTNNSIINTTAAGSTLNMNGTGGQTISGSGTWTATSAGRLLNLTINDAAGVTLNPTLAIQTNLTLTNGTLTASGLTIGVTATAVTVIRGLGDLANVPSFNYTTGVYNITYNGAATTYTVLNELPPSTTPTNGTLTVSLATDNVIQDKDATIANLTTSVAGATYNLNGYTLSITGAAPLTNTGTITANAATSTIRLAGTALQTFATGTTYTGALIANLIIDNSASVALGTQSATAGFSYGNVTINSGRAFSLATFLMRIAGTYTNSGTITANGAGATIMLDGASAQTFTIGTYTSNVLSNFIINNASGVTLTAPLNVSTVFTLTSGILTTTATNLLTVTATAPASVVGGSALNYVNGPLARTLAASLVSGSTFTFPVGKSAYNLFEMINPTTSNAGTVVVRVEAQDALAGGTDGTGFTAAPYPVKYWQATTSGTGVVTSGGLVRLLDASMGTLTTNNLVGNSSTLTGTYNSLGNLNVNTPATGNIEASITSPTSLGYYIIGTKGCLTGTYTIGAGANFTNLSQAIAMINSSIVCSDLVFELTPAYVGTAETYPMTLNAVNYSGGPWNITFRPQAGVSSAVTSGNPGSNVNFINLNGANYITFDGRAGGTGSTSAWLVRNAQIAATFTPTFQFINDASNDTLKYLQIESQNAVATSGTIFISTAVTTGNDNIVIDNNIIRDRSDVTGYPVNAIYASGTAAKLNDNVTISNNRIFNFWSAAAGSNGVNIFSNNSGFNIISNSFYQTASRTQTAAGPQVGILINSTAGGNFTITDNYIGGSAPNAGGSAWTVTGAFANTFAGISLSTGTAASSIQNNTITNLNLSCTNLLTTQPGIFSGIYVALNSAANIGDIAGNTIGAATGTGSIVLNNGTTGATANGIVNTAGGGQINIQNNTVGSITVQGTSAAISTNFIGVYFGPGISTAAGKIITNNTVGSTTTANSINLATASTNATAQNLYGMFYSTGTSSIMNLQNNTIANLNNNYAGTTTSLTMGVNIPNSANAVNITGNQVYNLSTSAPMTTTGASASLIGICAATSTTGHTVSNNIVYGLTNTAASAAVTVTGIYYAPSTNGTNAINANLIHSLSATSPSATINGLYLNAGTATVSNNMIRLGINAAGSAVTTNELIYGINDVATTNNIYFNSVYIGGSAASGSSNTYAYYGAVATGARAVEDNIFWNARTNSGGAGKHYAIRIGAITGLTSNYNDLLSATILGQTGAVDYATMSLWQGQSGTPDLNSISGDPQFTSATGDASTVDLHIQPSVPTPIEAAGLAIGAVPNDYDGQVRASYTPTDIGADADNFLPIDITPPVITITTPFANTCNGANIYTVSGVTITDASGIDATATYKPRLYYKKSTDANTVGGWQYVSTTSSSSPYSFNIDFTLLGGISPGDVMQYFVVAQDAAPIPNVAISSPTTFAAAPTNIALTSTAFPIGGTPGSFSILPCQGTVNVGSTEFYTGLTPNGAIFQAINSLPTGLTGDLTISITSDIAIENGVNALTNAKLNGFNVRIVPSAPTLRTISNVSALAVPMIPFSGAIGVTIDGSYGGSGQYLRFRNTHTTAASAQPVIQYYTSVSADTLENAIVESNASTITTGAVVVGIGTNTGIVISGNTITSTTGGAAGSPANGVYSNTATNTASIITGNNFENCTNSGVLLGTSNGSTWTISQNNFYQFTPSALAQSAISVGTGNGHTITGNIIGGSAAGATGASWVNSGNVAVTGISLIALTTGTPTIVDGNIIKNFSLTGTGTSSFTGINGGAGLYTLGSTNGNTISNVTSAGTGIVSGIASATAAIAATVSGNTVFALTNTNTAATTVRGIVISGTSASNLTGKNLIYNLNTGTNAGSAITGLEVSGAGAVTNNMIRLGYDVSGASITNAPIITGLLKDAASAANIWHNSVYIGGSGVTTTATNTYAFRRTVTGTDDIRNNVFVNARSNASTGGIHYAYVLNANATVTSNYNIFNVTGTGGALFSANTGTTPIATLQAWNVTPALDLNSGVGDPNYVAPTATTADLHVASPSPVESAGINIASVTDDYDGDNRAANTPVDIGADAVNVTPVDIYRPVVTPSALPTFNTSCGGGISATMTATITDAGTGVAAAALWYRRSLPSATTWSYFSGSLTGGTSANGTWTFPVSIPGAINGETYQFYFVAGDGAPTPNLGYAPYDATSPVHTSVTAQVIAPNTPYSIATALSAPLSGNVTVGTGGNYATFNGAAGLFAAINAAGLSGPLTVTVISNITETTTTPLNQISSPCGGGPYPVLIQPDGTTRRVISGSISGSVGLISYNGADSITIDGQYMGDGQQHLHFKNTLTNYNGVGYNATFYWYNDATYNTITNTIVEGLSKAQTNGNITGGVIMLGTGATAGNSYNVFSNDTITGTLAGGGADASTCLLFSQGTAGAPNANNQVINNSFKDFSLWSSQMADNFYGATLNRCYGLYVGATGNGSNWTITGNSFFTTFPENHGTFTALSFQPGSSSTNNTISGNYIGGSAPHCGMGPGAFKMMGSTYNSGGAIGYTETRYEGMIVNAGTATLSNNTIQRIWIENLYYSGFVGMDIQGNTNATVSNNIFGGLVAAAYTAPYNAGGTDIIEVDGGGGNQGSGYVYGIWTQNNVTLNADANTFNYMIQNGAGSAGGTIQCILHQASGGFVVTNNTNSAVHQEAAGTSYNSYGIRCSPTASSTGNRIENNQMSTIYVYGTTGSLVRSSAIYVNIANGLTVSGTIKNNMIYDNQNSENNGASDGIFLYGNTSGNGTWDIYNNMIQMDNDGLTTRLTMSGINVEMNSGSTTNVQYNSVWISGAQNTTTTTVGNAFSFYRWPGGAGTATGDVCTVKNNLLMNTRTGGNANSFFCPIANQESSPSRFTSDYNFLMFNSSATHSELGVYGLSVYARFNGATPNWQATTGLDAHSFTATYNATTTNFSGGTLKPTDLFTNPTIGDLHIAYTNGTSAYQFVDSRATPISITTDIDAEVRDASTPDIGADEFINCSRIVISAQPSPQTICAGGNAKFGVKNTGASPYTYQWQVSTDQGSTWSVVTIAAPYTTNAAGDTLSITGVTTALDSNLYRVAISNACGADTSNNALLHINAIPNITWESPTSHVNNVCAGSVTVFAVKGLYGTGYQWQVSPDSGATWSNVVNGAPYSVSLFSDTSYLSINTVITLNGNTYRCIVSNPCGADTSSLGSLIVQTTPTDTLAPGRVSICAGGAGIFHTGGTGVTTFAWQYNNGGTWTNVSNGTPAGVSYVGSATSDLVVSTAGTVIASNYLYRCQLNSLCGTAYSDTAVLNVMSGNGNAFLAGVTDSMLVETCPDGGWTYYSTYSEPEKWLFAIKKNGNTFDATPTIQMHFTSPTGYDSIADPTADKALYTMNRHWNVTINSGSLDSNVGKVSVRFFYDPADTVAMMNAAKAWALSHPTSLSGYTTSAHSVEWFKTRGIAYDPANNTVSSVPTSYTFAQTSYSYGVQNGVNYVELKDITSFSGGTAAIRVAPTDAAPLALPVKLLYLTATDVSDQYIRLDWATATEINNSGFDIERSTDGVNFATIGWVNGKGNSNTTVSYTLPDREVAPDVIYYYRLKQIDVDGHSAYSPIVSASIAKEGLIISDLIPNPTTTSTRVNVFSSAEQMASIQVYNATGQIVRTVNQNIYAGTNSIEINVADLASGIYMVGIQIADQHTSRRLIVK